MAGVFHFSWPVKEQERIDQFLIAHLDVPGDLRRVWRRFASHLRTEHKRTFDAMAHPITRVPWAPLDPDYAATKPPGTQNRILYRTGKLRKSLTKAKSPGSLFIAKKRYMSYGTAVPYSVFHQATARTRKDGASLNRPHVGMSAWNLRTLAKLIKTEIIGRVVRVHQGKK